MNQADPRAPVPPGPRYRTFSAYLRERFGGPVHKLPIDAGFTCPNRDGRVGTGGCVYCDGRGSALRRGGPLPSVAEQVRAGMERSRWAHGACRFIPYFQTFTNTYAPVAVLRALYDEALVAPDTVGLAVGTRPDCLSGEVIALLASYQPHREVWVELGVQSMHQRTLDRINRCHTVEVATDAIRRAASAGLKVCVHVILGLPGEGIAEMRATAEALARLPLAGLKLHSLLVLEGTPLADWHRRGEVYLPGVEEYASWVADVLERTPPEVVIQRLAADGYRDVLIAPEWANRKSEVRAAVSAELERRGTRQGGR